MDISPVLNRAPSIWQHVTGYIISVYRWSSIHINFNLPLFEHKLYVIKFVNFSKKKNQQTNSPSKSQPRIDGQTMLTKWCLESIIDLIIIRSYLIDCQSLLITWWWSHRCYLTYREVLQIAAVCTIHPSLSLLTEVLYNT